MVCAERAALLRDCTCYVSTTVRLFILLSIGIYVVCCVDSTTSLIVVFSLKLDLIAFSIQFIKKILKYWIILFLLYFIGGRHRLDFLIVDGYTNETCTISE